MERLGEEAFGNTNISRKVVLPATTQFVGYRPFRTRYTGMQPIFEGYEVDENNPYYAHNAEGMLLSKDGKVLYNCATGNIIPEGIERIAPLAFDQGISDITLPNSLKEIDSLVFHHYDIRNVYLYTTTPPRMHPMVLAGGKPYVHTKLYVPDGTLEEYKYAAIWNTFGEIIDNLDSCYAKPLPADSALACYVYYKVQGNDEVRYDFAMPVFSVYIGKVYQWDETIGNYQYVSGYSIRGNPINGNMESILQYSFEESVRIGYVIPSTEETKEWSIELMKSDNEKICYPIAYKGDLLMQNGLLKIKDASGKTVASHRMEELKYVVFSWTWSTAIRQFTIEWDEQYDFGYGPNVQHKKETISYYQASEWPIVDNDNGTRSLKYGSTGISYVSLSRNPKISMPQNKQAYFVKEKFQYFNLIDKDGNETSLPLNSFDEIIFEGDLVHFLDLGSIVNTFAINELKGMRFSKRSALALGTSSAKRVDDEPQHLYIHIGNVWKEVGLSRAGNVFTDGASLFIDSIAYPLTAIDSITFERPTEEKEVVQGVAATYAVTPLCPEVTTSDYALRFSASALTNKSKVKITPFYPSGLAAIEGVRSVKAYDITLDHDGTGQNTHQLHGVVEIRIPFIKRNGYKVYANYFDETDTVRAWRPICHHYDSVRQEMVILSNHLSRFGIFDIDNENSRNAKFKNFSVYDIPSLGESWEQIERNIMELAQCVTEAPNETKATLDWMAEKYSTASTFGLDMGYNFAQSFGFR